MPPIPFDVARILKQLEVGVTAPRGTWLEESWREPDAFATALAIFHAGRSAPPPKSRPGAHFDFYHDMVVRNVVGERVAMRVYDAREGWQQLTYAQLHARVTKRAGDWAGQGVKPGAKICLIASMGIELLVSLMSSVRLGACCSILPPGAPRFVSHRLTALAPDHIAAEPHQTPLFKSYEQLLLRDRGGSSRPPDSHTYAPADPVALLFSPLVDPPHVPVILKSDDAGVCALRDGLLTFMLRPDDHLAAPGSHYLQTQPALVFTTLLRGACFLHIDMPALERDPSLLSKFPVRSLGVNAALRDLLMRAKLPLRNVEHWFRNPEEPLDTLSWRHFVQTLHLDELPNSNVLIDAASGGAVLSSLRRRGEIHAEAQPGAGRSYSLLDMNVSGQEAPGEIGVFNLVPLDEKPLGYVVMSRVRGEFVYTGTNGPRREGRVFPVAEVIAALEGLPFNRGTCVVPVQSGAVLNPAVFVLVVFTGAEAAGVFESEHGARRLEITRRLETQLGAEFLPDRIELFPLYPHHQKGILDEEWCKHQYLKGGLHSKARDRVYQLLTDLRGWLAAETARAQGAPADNPTDKSQ